MMNAQKAESEMASQPRYLRELQILNQCDSEVESFMSPYKSFLPWSVSLVTYFKSKIFGKHIDLKKINW